jgi:hypothetical protein
MNLAERSSELTPGSGLLAAIVAITCLLALMFIFGGGSDK